MSKLISYDGLINQTVFPELQKAKSIAVKMKNGFKIPMNIIQNLANELRPYQIDAIQNLLLVNDSELRNLFGINVSLRHNIYHMATGSGKTMLMSATILYLYSLGYRKFIFLTQSLNLIEKTKNNLLPTRNSSKLEFSNTISFEGKEVNIKEVDLFSDDTNDIEISFKTVHSIHNEIQSPKENSLDYSKHKVALIADEAHHLQGTQKAKSDEDEKTWESSINIILNANPENRLYEYTATLGLKHPKIHEKYKDKIIYDFPLLKFRKDGYSKEVTLIRMSDNMTKDKVLLAAITSQYRYHIASEINIPLVPKILFKAQGTIEQLEQLKSEVQSHIQLLDLNYLLTLLKKYGSYKVFKFFQEDFKTDEEKEKFINSLKIMMGTESMISVHSKNPKNEKDRILKELNRIDENQSLRLVFAINILNEGWDVLSLFDIVKMDAINPNVKETTQESQLIGRGARQFPYNYQDKDKYKRKFDGVVHEKLRLLEEMFFYSANDNKYIEALHQSLVDIGLQDFAQDQIKDIQAIVTQRQKLENLLGINGVPKIFTNRLLELEETIGGISKYFSGKHTVLSMQFDFQLGEESILDNGQSSSENIQSISLKDLMNGNEFLFQRALRKLDFLNKGKNNYSNYEDLMKDFLDKDLNANLEIKISNGANSYNELTYDEKFSITLSILNKIREHIQKYRGKMYGSEDLDVILSIDETFKEYTKSERFCLEYGEKTVKEFHLNAKRETLKGVYRLLNKDLFYYDKATWDSEEELELYQYLDQNIPKNEFENILIIRNENENFKVFSTDKGIDSENLGKGFCPDFIILKRVLDELHIFFIEVKGMQDTEEWKKLLIKNLLKGKTKIIEGIVYRIIGIDEFCTSVNRDSLIKGSGII